MSTVAGGLGPYIIGVGPFCPVSNGEFSKYCAYGTRFVTKIELLNRARFKSIRLDLRTLIN